MAPRYRYWCGECHHRTPWLAQAQSADLLRQHYSGRHPGIPPGGRGEVRRPRSPDGVGCLALMAALLLALLLAASCQHQPVRHRAAPGPTRAASEVLRQASAGRHDITSSRQM